MAEQYQTDVARGRWERRRRIAQMFFGGLLFLLIGDVLCSLVVPFVGLLQLVLLKNLLFPPPPLPDEVIAYPTTVSIWGGRVYARGNLPNTAIFDAQSGKLLSTMSGVVVGSDAQFLYVNTGATPDNTFDLDTLTARDSGGNIVWSYKDAHLTLSLIQDYRRSSLLLPQLQSDANNVYVLANNKRVPRGSRLLALNKSTGAVRWSYDVTGAARFVLAQDTLVLLSDRELTAFTVRDGRQLWKQPNNAWTNFASAGQLLYLQNELGVRALSLHTGRQAWMVSYDPQRPDTPFVLDSGIMYLSAYMGKIIAIDTRDGRLLWRATVGDNREAITPLAAQNSVLYTYLPLYQALPSNRLLSAISGANGRTLWTTPLQAERLTFVGETGGALYFAAGSVWCENYTPTCANISAINARSGKRMWSQAESQMNVVMHVQGQTLYVASLVHRNQVSRELYGRYNYGPNCSDTVTLTSLSAIDGTVEWRNSAPFHCTRDIAY